MSYERKTSMNRESKVNITVLLVAINVLVFLGLSFVGATEDSVFMLQHGAMYPTLILENGEYYRLITCMFLHFGIQHLLNNMITLVILGQILEKEIGCIKYVFIYFIGGIGASIISLIHEINTQEYAVSAGASGAIFAIVGALIYMAIRNRGRIANVSQKQLVFICILTLYQGFTTIGVDNAAHIGGGVMGFVLALLLYHKKRTVRNTQNKTN